MHHKDGGIERRSQGYQINMTVVFMRLAGMTGETDGQHRWAPRSQVSGLGMKYVSRNGRGKGKKLNIVYESC